MNCDLCPQGLGCVQSRPCSGGQPSEHGFPGQSPGLTPSVSTLNPEPQVHQRVVGRLGVTGQSPVLKPQGTGWRDMPGSAP